MCSAAENWPGHVGSGRVVDVVFHSSACVSRPGARAAQKKIIKWAAATATFSFWSCSFFSVLSRALVRLLFSLSLSPLLFLFSAVCMLFPCLSSSSSVSFSLLSQATTKICASTHIKHSTRIFTDCFRISHFASVLVRFFSAFL